MQGNYEKALMDQLRARDYAYFASPYQPKLMTYWRSVNKENLEENLKNAQKNIRMQF